MLEIPWVLLKSFMRYFFSSMMSSLVILMCESVFACGFPKMSFGY